MRPVASERHRCDHAFTDSTATAPFATHPRRPGAIAPAQVGFHASRSIRPRIRPKRLLVKSLSASWSRKYRACRISRPSVLKSRCCRLFRDQLWMATGRTSRRLDVSFLRVGGRSARWCQATRVPGRGARVLQAVASRLGQSTCRTALHRGLTLAHNESASAASCLLLRGWAAVVAGGPQPPAGKPADRGSSEPSLGASRRV